MKWAVFWAVLPLALVGIIARVIFGALVAGWFVGNLLIEWVSE